MLPSRYSSGDGSNEPGGGLDPVPAEDDAARRIDSRSVVGEEDGESSATEMRMAASVRIEGYGRRARRRERAWDRCLSLSETAEEERSRAARAATKRDPGWGGTAVGAETAKRNRR